MTGTIFKAEAQDAHLYSAYIIFSLKKRWMMYLNKIYVCHVVEHIAEWFPNNIVMRPTLKLEKFPRQYIQFLILYVRVLFILHTKY